MKLLEDDAMTTKLADKKGRIFLGSEFANITVILDDSTPGQIIIKPAKVVPLVDAWLYDNEKALTLVRKGLKQAQKDQFSENPPDLEADAELADSIED